MESFSYSYNGIGNSQNIERNKELDVMKKRILFLLFSFMLITTQVFAHSGLKSSSPKNGDVVTHPIQEITIQFSGNIERGSKIEIKNEQGDSVPVRSIDTEGKVLKATLDKPLPNGSYKVRWMNIGEDGHPLRGNLSFQVKVPQGEQAGERRAPSKEDTQPAPEQSNTDHQNEEQQQENSAFMIGFIIIGILIIGSLIFLFQKIKK